MKFRFLTSRLSDGTQGSHLVWYFWFKIKKINKLLNYLDLPLIKGTSRPVESKLPKIVKSSTPTKVLPVPKVRRSASGTSSSGYASADTKPATSRPSSARSDLSRDKINNNFAYVRCSMTEEDLKKWQDALKIREEKLDLRETELAKVSLCL